MTIVIITVYSSSELYDGYTYICHQSVLFIVPFHTELPSS